MSALTSGSPTLLQRMQAQLPCADGEALAATAIAAGAGFASAGPFGVMTSLGFTWVIRPCADHALVTLMKLGQDKLGLYVPCAKDSAVTQYTVTLLTTIGHAAVAGMNGSAGVWRNTMVAAGGLAAGKITVKVADTAQEKTGITEKDSVARRIINFFSGLTGSWLGAKATDAALDAFRYYAVQSADTEAESLSDTGNTKQVDDCEYYDCEQEPTEGEYVVAPETAPWQEAAEGQSHRVRRNAGEQGESGKWWRRDRQATCEAAIETVSKIRRQQTLTHLSNGTFVRKYGEENYNNYKYYIHNEGRLFLFPENYAIRTYDTSVRNAIVRSYAADVFTYDESLINSTFFIDRSLYLEHILGGSYVDTYDNSGAGTNFTLYAGYLYAHDNSTAGGYFTTSYWKESRGSMAASLTPVRNDAVTCLYFRDNSAAGAQVNLKNRFSSLRTYDRSAKGSNTTINTDTTAYTYEKSAENAWFYVNNRGTLNTYNGSAENAWFYVNNEGTVNIAHTSALLSKFDVTGGTVNAYYTSGKWSKVNIHQLGCVTAGDFSFRDSNFTLSWNSSLWVRDNALANAQVKINCGASSVQFRGSSGRGSHIIVTRDGILRVKGKHALVDANVTLCPGGNLMDDRGNDISTREGYPFHLNDLRNAYRERLEESGCQPPTPRPAGSMKADTIIPAPSCTSVVTANTSPATPADETNINITTIAAGAALAAVGVCVTSTTGFVLCYIKRNTLNKYLDYCRKNGHDTRNAAVELAAATAQVEANQTTGNLALAESTPEHISELNTVVVKIPKDSITGTTSSRDSTVTDWVRNELELPLPTPESPRPQSLSTATYQ